MIYGYGLLLSEVPLTSKRKSTTKAYIALRKHLISDIVIEAVPTLQDTRFELDFLINSLNPEDVIVFASLEALGSNAEEAFERIYKIDSFGGEWAILGYPDLSSYNIETFQPAPIESFENLYRNLKLANYERTTGRKSIPISEKFIDVFFDWQNYFISTEEACTILNMTTATFYNKASDFIRSPRHRQNYIHLYDLRMEKWEKKPMRGPKFKDPKYLEVLRDLQRELGAYKNWRLQDVDEFLMFKYMGIDLIAQDIIRLYLNFSVTGATTKAAKEFYNPEVLKKYK